MSSPNSPCAACKFLRRKCTQECVFAPYFPPEQPAKFASVHRVFGASNVAKLLNEIPAGQREDAVNSLAYEADARLRDPVYGCVGLISILQHKLKQLHIDLDTAKQELSKYIGPQAMLPNLGSVVSPSYIAAGMNMMMMMPPNHHHQSMMPMMGFPTDNINTNEQQLHHQQIYAAQQLTTTAEIDPQQQQQQQRFEQEGIRIINGGSGGGGGGGEAVSGTAGLNLNQIRSPISTTASLALDTSRDNRAYQVELKPVVYHVQPHNLEGRSSGCSTAGDDEGRSIER